MSLVKMVVEIVQVYKILSIDILSFEQSLFTIRAAGNCYFVLFWTVLKFLTFSREPVMEAGSIVAACHSFTAS